ncbi:MAG: hypothetical protein ACTSRA_08940, partial [Promethearchaeota archaeon]
TACLTGYSIEYITSIPDWVDYWILDDNEIEKYANYTQILVEHYKNQIREWQIGNEVDLIWLLHHKRGGHGYATSQEGLNATEWQIWPSEENIIRWYKAVSRAVKNVNESFEVHVNLVCGCSSWENFIQRIIQETQVDAIGIDLYPGTIHMSYAEEYFIELKQFKKWIDEADKNRTIELVLAEFGYAADTSQFPTTEITEARTLRDHFAVIQRCPVKRAFFHQIFDKPSSVYGYSIPKYEQNIGIVDGNLQPSPAFHEVLPAFSGVILPITATNVFGSLVRFVLAFLSIMGSPANYQPYLSPFTTFICFIISKIILGLYLGLISKKKVVQKIQISLISTWLVMQFGLFTLCFGAWPIKPTEMIPAYFGSMFVTSLIISIIAKATQLFKTRIVDKSFEIHPEKKQVEPESQQCQSCGKTFSIRDNTCPHCKYNEVLQIKITMIEKSFYPGLVVFLTILFCGAYVYIYGYIHWIFEFEQFPWWFKDTMAQITVIYSWIGWWWLFIQALNKTNKIKTWPIKIKTIYLLIVIIDTFTWIFPIIWIYQFPFVAIASYTALTSIAITFVLQKILITLISKKQKELKKIHVQ